MENYIKAINNEFEKVQKSDLSEIIKMTLSNYSTYHTFFISQQRENINISKNDKKLKTINELNMHSTFLMDAFIRNILTNNYISVKITIKSLIEFYIKYKFLLHSDSYVSEVYKDSEILTLSKRAKSLNLNQNLSNTLNNSVTTIQQKYNFTSTNDEHWIKLSLDHLKGTKNSEKSLSAIHNYLKKENLIDDYIYDLYKNNCDFAHIGANSLETQQTVDQKLESGHFCEVYSESLIFFNYIILDIFGSYISVFNIKKENTSFKEVQKRKNKIESIISETIN